MKSWLLLFCFAIAGTCVNAQDLTGIWRGYFNSGSGYFQQKYKYEVQINELSNKNAQKGVTGVTYSYHTTVFYGKATLQGIYDGKSKSITLMETKMLEMKMEVNTQPCLMTCYLDYRKNGNTEVLEGTFTSVVADTKGDCGSGYVYLEKVQESDFGKEDFLVKKPKPLGKKLAPRPEDKNALIASPAIKKANPPIVKKTTPPVSRNSDSAVAKKQAPFSETDTASKAAPAPPAIAMPSKKAPEDNITVPEEIKDRDNPLVKKIITNSADILIELYDNGEIDGDTITVYDNNQIIAYRRGLTQNAITINLKATIENPVHEIVMVANNLGRIPPNTALMVVTTGGKRYELFLSSDEKSNAKVLIQLSVPGAKSN